jgi:hypothetical protein
MSWTTIEDQIQIADIGGRLLANLAKGIYTPDTVLREYVQNAADALMSLSDPPDPLVISITIDQTNKSITIFDKGNGMDKRGVHDAKKIAVSPKSSDEYVGFRGIGIWAGFQACAKLELETTKAGDTNKYRLEIDFSDILAKVNENISIKDLLDKRFRISTQKVEGDKSAHYTSVTLVGLHDDYLRLVDEAEVRKIVSQNLPCQFDPAWSPSSKILKRLIPLEGYREFQIQVNKQPVYKEFTEFDNEPQFCILQGDDDTEIGLVWWCEIEEGAIKALGNQFRGFRLRVKNFAVGPLNIFDDEDGSHWGVTGKAKILKTVQRLNRFVGEIYVTNPDIVPDTPRNNLELNQSARDAIEQIRLFYTVRLNEAGGRSEFISVSKSLDAAEKLIDSGSADVKLATPLLEKLKEARTTLAGSQKANTSKKFAKQFLLPRKKQIENTIKKLDAIVPKKATKKTSTASMGISVKTKTPPGSLLAANGEIEELCSDIIEIIRKQIEDMDVLATISQQIVELFRNRGLLAA